MQEISVFDIIGPVMVGPSSSHTAGAVRLGRLARAILGGQPHQARIELHGSFAQTGQGHGTDKALVAGLLGFNTDDPRIVHSLEIATELGLHVDISSIDLGEHVHPNTARFTLGQSPHMVRVRGASIGGGEVEITRINDYDVAFNGNYPTLLIQGDDRPGTINAVSGFLMQREINIAALRVTRSKRGGLAMMILETDQAVPPGLRHDINQMDWVRWLRYVED